MVFLSIAGAESVADINESETIRIHLRGDPDMILDIDLPQTQRGSTPEWAGTVPPPEDSHRARDLMDLMDEPELEHLPAALASRNPDDTTKHQRAIEMPAMPELDLERAPLTTDLRREVKLFARDVSRIA
jgi:hypothetical protein